MESAPEFREEGKTPKKRNKKKILIIVGIVVAALFVLGIFLPDDEDAAGSDIEYTEPTYLDITETGTVFGWEIKINSVQSLPNYYRGGAGEGNTYFTINITIKNLESKTRNFWKDGLLGNSKMTTSLLYGEINYLVTYSASNKLRESVPALGFATDDLTFKVPEEVWKNREGVVLSIAENKRNTTNEVFWLF